MENDKIKRDKVELNINLEIIFKSSLVVFVGIFLSKLFTYLYRIIIARYFGPEAYGLYTLAFMLLGWFVAFSSLGLTQGLVRFIPNYRGKKQLNNIKLSFAISIIILLISTIFSTLVLFFASDIISTTFFHNQELSIFLKVFSFLIPLFVI